MKIPDIIKRDWQVMTVSLLLAILIWLLANTKH
jgi:YbbR domain-containing protein